MENEKIKSHPCFNADAKHTSARVHLPVAPKCNIQCSYCNRKYDCVNESRPGVTSSVLTPWQALEYLKELSKRIDNISVIGIAGPGDPFSNPQETLQTIKLVKEKFPDKILCLSTNGLNLEPYINDISALGVTHVTITINGVNPEVTGKVYQWVRHEKKIYRGIEGAKYILERQLACIPLLKEKGIIVKINSIVMPGINDHHIGEIAKVVSSLGADLINCIPVIPSPDTVFEDMKEPDPATLFKVRAEASAYMKLMTHCARCRADAAGLLGQDYKESFAMIRQYASQPLNPSENRPYVAVASYEGLLVNRHLGETTSFSIYRETPNGYKLVEERGTPPPGSGDFRWIELSRTLSDCRSVLVSGAGQNPMEILKNNGIRVIQMTGLIDEGLDAVYKGKNLRTVSKSNAFKCGSDCKGNARGCA